MSFVYSHDITELILRISGIRSNSPIDPKILFASYNLASPEVITLPELFNQIVFYLQLMRFP